MTKPIEPGCRAVIVNSKAGNDGLIVTVRYVKELGRPFKKGVWWEIDKKVKYTDGQSGYWIMENQLQRIDDYDGNEATTWESMKDIWQPKEISVCNLK